MPPSEKTEPDAPNPKNDTIHKHLRTQFYGVFTKLTQEIDPIIKRKEDLREDLEDLKDLLKDACERYSKNIEMDREEAIEHFCKDCQQTISSYKKSPGGYPSLV